MTTIKEKFGKQLHKYIYADNGLDDIFPGHFIKYVDIELTTIKAGIVLKIIGNTIILTNYKKKGIWKIIANDFHLFYRDVSGNIFLRDALNKYLESKKKEK
jgi:hypothetical protein